MVALDDDQRRFQRPPHLEAALARLFARQHGVASLGQLVALGLSPRAVQHRAMVGRWVRVHRGVYAVAGAPLTPDGVRMAAVLACGPGAMVSHRSAAALWGLMRWRPSRPEVTVAGHARNLPGIDLHRSRSLGPLDRAEIRGIPATTLHRTIVDLAELLDLHRLERVIHEAEVQHRVDVGQIEAVLRRVRGRRVEPHLRAALGLPTVGHTESALEEAFLALCRIHHLGPPRCGAALTVDGRLLTVDALFLPERVVVELDGEHVHGTRRMFHMDRRRDAMLAAAGYLVVRLTWTRMTREAEAVAAELTRILARRRVGAG